MQTGYSGALPPERFNMARYCLEAAAHATPHKDGLIVLTGSKDAPSIKAYSYADLNDQVRRIATALRADGLKSGDRLLIRLANTPEYALLFFGAIAAGIVPIPASSQLTDPEATHIANDADISAAALETADTLIVGNRTVRTYTRNDIEHMCVCGPVADYADTSANDPAFLIYTSGTTNKPKGVLHAHRSAWGRRPIYRDWYAITPEDRMLHAGALNWTYTLGTGLTDPWANGATAIINTSPRVPTDWPELIRKTGATLFAAVPSLYRQILKYAPPGPIDTGNLSRGLTAGEHLPPSIADEWKARTGTDLCEALGMSEISTYISSSPTHPAKPGTIGRPQSGRCINILPLVGGTTPLPAGEIGLLAIHRSDPGLMIDYWNRPEETKNVFRGDWFIGGDLASMDSDGYVRHEGRSNDLMNAFGYRVSPLEIEHTLAACPGVNEVAVTELNIRPGVSIVAAFIATEEASKDKLSQRLQQHARTNLAEYKRPKEFFFTDTFPRTSNGKIRRAELQHIYDAQKAHP